MPRLIEHIDAIARKKQRDVLFLRFSDPSEQDTGDGGPLFYSDWASLAGRQSVIEWLNNNQINWQPCGELANTHVMASYSGLIYIDVPFDEADPSY